MTNPTMPAASAALTTCRDVERWLVATFLVLPGTPIFSPRRGEGQFLDPNIAPSAFDWIAFSADVLGRNSRERLFLLTWARVEARRRAIQANLPNPPGGGSIADFCKEYPVGRRTFDRTRERACRDVADAWNTKVRRRDT